MRCGSLIPWDSLLLRGIHPVRSDTYLALVAPKTNGFAAEMSHLQVFFYCIAVSCSEDRSLCECVKVCGPSPLPLLTADGSVPKEEF